MSWDALLAEFRELGGVAENIRISDGPHGRSVFVVDHAKPAALIAPESLLVPVESLEVRDGQLETTARELGARERAFFNAYQREYGWGAGGLQAAWSTQQAWHELPVEVSDFIKTMGALTEPNLRFLPPTIDVCRLDHVRNREFIYRNRLVLAPIVDCTNHASAAAGHVSEGGVGVRGNFESEIFLRYNISDAWAHALSYSFSDKNPFAYSLALQVDVFGKRFEIGRAFDQSEIRDGVLFPRTADTAGKIHIPQLMLGNSSHMDLPRGVFRKIMSEHFTLTQADNVFDSILQFNRAKFLSLVRVLDTYRSPMVDTLKEAALNQLEALCSCVGARAL